MNAIDELGTDLLRHFGVRATPPVDVEALAGRLGVLQIETRSMFEEGRLERRGADTRIFVRKDLTVSRRRFTIAHELAHLLLADPGARDLVAHRRLERGDEERLCDRIAAALVLPAPWVQERFAHRPQNLSTIRHVAHIGQVSMAAATVRLAEICNWRSSLLRWRRDRERWVFVAGAAIPAPLHGIVRSAPTTSNELDAVGKRSGRDQRTTLSLLIGDCQQASQAQVSVRATSALALTELRQYVGNRS